jgi:hypothetical protein
LTGAYRRITVGTRSAACGCPLPDGYNTGRRGFRLRKDDREFVRERARAPKDVYVREIASASFAPAEATHAVALKDELFAVFRRVAPGGAAPSRPHGQ